MRYRALFVALALFAAPVGAAAEPLPAIERIVTADERQYLPTVSRLIEGNADREEMLVALDALLVKLSDPTPFRGLIQFLRANIFADLDKPAQARAAIMESIRLLPEYSAPLVVAAQIYAYDDDPGPAADYLIRASRIDPGVVNVLDGYEIANILGRLNGQDDRRRTLALSERLLESGWKNGTFAIRSTMAEDVIEARIERGDAGGAVKMVSSIVIPSIIGRLLTEKRFDALRPAAEGWAGARMEKLWPRYIAEARAAWEASNAPETARDYAGALAVAGHDKALIATFVPVFGRKLDAEDDHDLIFIVPSVASASAREGDWDQAYRLYDQALRIWPAGSSANVINLTANRATLKLREGKFEEALAGIEAVLAEAKPWGGQVSKTAYQGLHLYRACALEELGRQDEGVTSGAIVASSRGQNPMALAHLQLCRKDIAGARETLMTALENEQTQGDVIAFVQPVDDRVMQSAYANAMDERWRRVRSDPKLLAAVRKYGHVRSEPLNATAPPERMPEALRPAG